MYFQKHTAPEYIIACVYKVSDARLSYIIKVFTINSIHTWPCNEDASVFPGHLLKHGLMTAGQSTILEGPPQTVDCLSIIGCIHKEKRFCCAYMNSESIYRVIMCFPFTARSRVQFQTRGRQCITTTTSAEAETLVIFGCKGPSLNLGKRQTALRFLMVSCTLARQLKINLFLFISRYMEKWK